MNLEAGSRTLVTGSAGRLGRSVVTALAEAGHEVIGVDTRAGHPGRGRAPPCPPT